MKLLKPCVHKRYEAHQEKQLLRGGHFNEIWCPGGTEPTTDELLAALAEAEEAADAKKQAELDWWGGSGE